MSLPLPLEYVDWSVSADCALSSRTHCSPGHMSAVTGHHYANPTNHFWHCLHLSGTFPIPASPGTMSRKKTPIAGFTQRLLLPSEDCTLPERYNLGLVRIVPSCPSLRTSLFFFSSFHFVFSRTHATFALLCRLTSLSVHRPRKLSYQPKRWPALCQRF